MVTHNTRPIRIWQWNKGKSKLQEIPTYKYNNACKWPCEAEKAKSVEDIKDDGSNMPAICRECAVRLGLEW